MGIFRDVSIPFGGRDYVITPSNRLLCMIDKKGRRELGDHLFAVSTVCYRATLGAGLNDLAFVLAEFINSAGGKVTDDDALAEITGFKNPDELRAYIELICGVVMPEVKAVDEKKPEAPTQPAT